MESNSSPHSALSPDSISLEKIRAAQEVVYQTLAPTPLQEYPVLNQETGLRLFLKHENHLPTGAFKIRGGLNLMHHFVAGRTHDGVITATRGNHGQSVALAATLYSIPVTIVTSEPAPRPSTRRPWLS